MQDYVLLRAPTVLKRHIFFIFTQTLNCSDYLMLIVYPVIDHSVNRILKSSIINVASLVHKSVMAALLCDDVVVNGRNVRYQAHTVDDGDEHLVERQVGSMSLPTGVSTSSEDYVEERYKVDRRKLEQMIQGKDKQNPTG